MSTSNNSHRYALVTGASSGIGASFARELARRGCNLVLTARRQDRLQALCEELPSEHGIKCVAIPCDLARPQAPAELVAAIEERDLTIGVLINNAGYGVPGTFDAQPWQVHRDFMQVLMRAPTELIHRLLPSMRERGFGRIINVASLAGHLPGSSGHTLYAASKAYMIRFSQSLALENAVHGVNVCGLCPGFTHSEFHDVTGARELVSRLPRWMWMDADTVARQGLDAVERGDAVYVNGRINAAIKAFADLIPDRLAMWLSARHSNRYRVTD